MWRGIFLCFPYVAVGRPENFIVPPHGKKAIIACGCPQSKWERDLQLRNAMLFNLRNDTAAFLNPVPYKEGYTTIREWLCHQYQEAGLTGLSETAHYLKITLIFVLSFLIAACIKCISVMNKGQHWDAKPELHISSQKWYMQASVREKKSETYQRRQGKLSAFG